MGRATLTGLRSLMEDWGLDVDLAPRLRADLSAAQGFASIRVLGRQRHVSTRLLGGYNTTKPVGANCG